MLDALRQSIEKILTDAGVSGELTLSTPPKPDMGDVAFGCFALAQGMGKNPAKIAKQLSEDIDLSNQDLVQSVSAAGPFVNFTFDPGAVTKIVLETLEKEGESYGKHKTGKGKNIMLEFAHPNTHKAFHIGHFRNILTGESLCRLLENSGHKVIRANYQGDVGMHIAKALYGIEQLQSEYEEVKDKELSDRVAFLGKAYAAGASAFEESEEVKEAVGEYNAKIYTKDESIKDVYETTRGWSLEYFDAIYDRVGTKFDRLYFESEVFQRGTELVNEYLEKGVFKKSEGAIIFEGSKHGLHDRVFINSKGYATYEGKEIGLAELQFAEHSPEKIIHITGAEQANYFQVVFRAAEQVFPDVVGKEKHMSYGWVHLKEGKMSSRTGNVVLAEWLIEEVQKKIADVMKDVELENKEETLEKISLGAIKYAFLKTGIKNDIAFDLDASISTSGNSGPYLQYICARIKSILRKAEGKSSNELPAEITAEEKDLALQLSAYPTATGDAAEKLDPSIVAQYLFGLAKSFNSFYAACPVITDDAIAQGFRLRLLGAVLATMEQGMHLLGMESVEQM